MGFWEIFIVFIVALVVIKPKQWPRIAKQAGQFIHSMKRFTGTIKDDMQKELDLEANEVKAKQADIEYENLNKLNNNQDQTNKS